MRKVCGTLDGTGAVINVGLGFKPDYVRLWNTMSSNPFYAEWNTAMRTVAQAGGYSIDNATPARYLEVAGINMYLGGDVADGTETYLMPFDAVHPLQGNLARKGSLVTSNVTTWTYDTANNDRTGTISAINSTYVNVGSKIRITGTLSKKQYEAFIVVVNSTTDLELSAVVPSGTVDYLGPKFDYVAATSGVIMPCGFTIATTGNLNTNSETIAFEAGTYL